jgi:hypothetical protein
MNGRSTSNTINAASFLTAAFVALLLAVITTVAQAADLRTTAKQITLGPKHHFFSYIGHVRKIPWNCSGRNSVALRTDFQHHGS